MTKEEFILQSASLGYYNKSSAKNGAKITRKTTTPRKILKSFFVGAKLVGKRITPEFGTAFAVLKQQNATSTHTKCERNQTGG